MPAHGGTVSQPGCHRSFPRKGWVVASHGGAAINCGVPALAPGWSHHHQFPKIPHPLSSLFLRGHSVGRVNLCFQMLLEDLIKHHLKFLNGNCYITHDYYPFSLNTGPTAKLLGASMEITKIFKYPLSETVVCQAAHLIRQSLLEQMGLALCPISQETWTR